MFAANTESEAAKAQRVLAWLGDTYVTHGVNALTQNHSDKLALTELFYRHASGDWGDMGEADKKLNHDMLVKGGECFQRGSLGAKGFSLLPNPIEPAPQQCC